jgi:hypothetical protein
VRVNLETGRRPIAQLRFLASSAREPAIPGAHMREVLLGALAVCVMAWHKAGLPAATRARAVPIAYIAPRRREEPIT